MSFNVTVRTAAGVFQSIQPAESAIDAFLAAAEAHGQAPCGITVTPAEEK